MGEPDNIISASSVLPDNIPEALLQPVYRDICRVLDVLEQLINKAKWDDDDFKLYTINTHGIKSAMANINVMELSETAKMLELAGREKNFSIIRTQTPDLINALKEIAILISKRGENIPIGIGSDEMLHTQLTVLQNACKTYDKNLARNVLSELSKYSWNEKITSLIASLNACMPHSEFETIEKVVKKHLSL